MTTDPFEDYDEESQELLRGLKMFDFDELQQRMNRSLFPVADNTNYISFQERSNEYAMSTPFGKNSLFYVENGFLINSEIDAQVLMGIIKKQTQKRSIFKIILY